MASDWCIGRKTPPWVFQAAGRQSAWSSTWRSGNLPRPGGSGYSRLSSGMRSVRMKETPQVARACTSGNRKVKVSFSKLIMASP